MHVLGPSRGRFVPFQGGTSSQGGTRFQGRQTVQSTNNPVERHLGPRQALTRLRGPQVGRVVRVGSREDVDAAAELAGRPGVVVMAAEDWQSIPAENLVAAFTVRGRLID